MVFSLQQCLGVIIWKINKQVKRLVAKKIKVKKLKDWKNKVEKKRKK